MPDMSNEELTQAVRDKKEMALLGQIAHLLVAESLIDADEQIRFMTLLKEEE